MLEAVGIFAVASVGGAATGFDVGDRPRFGADCSEKGVGIHGSCTFFCVVGLGDQASSIAPELIQSCND